MTGDVRLHPDPHLRITCTPVTDFDSRIAAIGADMLRVMYDAYGRGLAAPQLGGMRVSDRLFVMDAGWKVSGQREGRICINPEVLWTSDDKATHTEACLSIPDTPRRIARPAEIEAAWQDETGTCHTARLTGAEAVIFQHELDHLDGRLILDHPEAP